MSLAALCSHWKEYDAFIFAALLLGATIGSHGCAAHDSYFVVLDSLYVLFEYSVSDELLDEIDLAKQGLMLCLHPANVRVYVPLIAKHKLLNSQCLALAACKASQERGQLDCWQSFQDRHHHLRLIKSDILLKMSKKLALMSP